MVAEKSEDAVREYHAKKNQDGSFSISMPAKDLAELGYVDYYDEKTGAGFQRYESVTARRGRDIAAYMKRCKSKSIPPRLGEVTANARTAKWKFEPLDPKEPVLGFLNIDVESGANSISMIDGGTRLVGIRTALAANTLRPDDSFDVRLFTDLSVAEEIALFLLINDKQKKVRTDLGLRVVQRRLDEDDLSDHEKAVLGSVVPDTETWRFNASRIAAAMNSQPDSPWFNRIQMPGDKVSKPIKLQAMFTSLKPILTDDDILSRLQRLETQGLLMIGGETVEKDQYLARVLRNFWRAVASASPKAHEEPSTNVLWGSIGASSGHIALAKIISSVLTNEQQPNLTQARFAQMVSESQIATYEFWFSKAGAKKDDYPTQKGEATKMTGAANYARLAKQLEEEWRAALHAKGPTAAAIA